MNMVDQIMYLAFTVFTGLFIYAISTQTDDTLLHDFCARFLKYNWQFFILCMVAGIFWPVLWGALAVIVILSIIYFMLEPLILAVVGVVKSLGRKMDDGS